MRNSRGSCKTMQSNQELAGTKIKFKGGGQECPPYIIYIELIRM